MFSFSIVKKLGDGRYLDEARLIIERVRREKALSFHHTKFDNKKHKSKPFKGDGKPKPS